MDNERNGYMLKRSSASNGYDWWWHSFTAENDLTGELEPFFIEYFIINPARGSKDPIFGQLPGQAQKPAYAMIKAGKWGENKAQINTFYGTDQFEASRKRQDVRIGNNIATETRLKGSVEVSEIDAKAHPEFMTDPGSLSWDLEVKKEITYSVGYGASRLFRALNLFQMFWHVQGMKTYYRGTLNFKGQSYTVKNETSHGYQDKNWGRDFTNPWLWLNCNNFTDAQGEALPQTSLDIGGGNPTVLGIGLGAKLLAAFHHEGKLYEFNFSHLFFQKQDWHCHEDENNLYWNIFLSNRTHNLKVNFSCPKAGMLLINYENPQGKKNHSKLWNGGHASGTLVLSERKTGAQVCRLHGSLGGCEYGEY